VGIIRRIFYVSSAGATALDFINHPRAHPSSCAGALHPSCNSASGHVVKTMRAMVMHRHGGPEVITLEREWPRPELPAAPAGLRRAGLGA
jgi:hypothetical protein